MKSTKLSSDHSIHNSNDSDIKLLKFQFSTPLWLLTVSLAKNEFSRHEYLVLVVFAYQYFPLLYSVGNS